MNTRKIKVNSGVEPCPSCGNNKDFTIKSDYCAEDCCEVWAVCECGHEGERFEDVWGGVSDENCYAAMSCWNDLMRSDS